MKLGTVTKQPEEFKDYTIDYSPWLTPVEDTIDDVRFEVECLTDPDDDSLKIVGDTEYTETALKFWVEGGTAGYRYKVTVFVSTVIGRIDESEVIFKIKDY